MNFGEWKPYVSVAERWAKAEKAVGKAKKSGAILSPIAPFRGAIAKTFWGKAWCDNLGNYSDYANRLQRGSSYVRSGSVIDLQITPGEVRAQVVGSSLYTVTANVTAVPDKQWETICADCSGSIDSLVELLQGKLSNAVMERICKPGTGLFPSPKEITFDCSCPDRALMCKHVAAVLYGVGTRLDQQPEVIFSLRRVDAEELVQHAHMNPPAAQKRMNPGKRLDDALLADVFGIEMAEVALPAKPVAARVTAKQEAKAANSTARKMPLPAKTATGQKAASSKAGIKSRARLKKSATGKDAIPEKKAAISPAIPKTMSVATRRAGAQPAKVKGKG